MSKDQGNTGQLDAQRQYLVIGTLALLFIIFCFVNFLCEQGSGPEGDDAL